ncbi:hypothetical protein K466DRAFT_652032 [Polyporus arcularius HHB13444]|uniref:Uncharacterized protein n=1 Tax=Polyporus arcularius HHB13444 TaxID=1314778 RepID=A0A5C3PJR4_9APHY|nr:hypothetical protein K466DRAFT_652032 [Polyporus arcularius HHB13444]
MSHSQSEQSSRQSSGDTAEFISQSIRDNARWTSSEQVSAASAKPVDLRAFQTLPKSYQKEDHYYAYGWELQACWANLVEYGRQAAGVADDETDDARVRDGLVRLRLNSRVLRLYSEFEVEAPKGHPDFRHEENTKAGVERRPMQIVAIAFTKDRYPFSNCPLTKGQLEWLNKILGEPRWYRTYYSKEDWHKHGVE